MQGGLRVLIRHATDAIPGFSIASVGMAAALCTYESGRMSSFQSIGTAEFLSPHLLAPLIVLAALALVYHRRPGFRLHRHSAVGFAIAIVLTCALLENAGFFPLLQEQSVSWITQMLIESGRILLLSCWAEIVIMFESRASAAMIAVATVALGAFIFLLAFVKPDAANILVSFLPILSTSCLYWFKDRNDSLDSYLADKQPTRYVQGIDTHLVRASSTRTALTAFLAFLLPLACYSFTFGYIHFTWIPAQDGSVVSTGIQVAAAIGTAFGGVFLLLLVAQFWGRRRIELYGLFIMPVLLLSLYLASLQIAGAPFSYVFLLNIVQKVAFFLAWLAPFLVRATSPMVVWCAALGAYQLGKLLSNSAQSGIGSDVYTWLVLVSIIVLSTGIIIGILSDQRRKPGKEGSLQDDTQETAQHEDGVPEAPTRKEQACAAVAQQYRLTRREEEILGLLAEGMTANSIAEALIVSTATAKSHMRNIYAKTDVHSQSELLLKVQEHM